MHRKNKRRRFQSLIVLRLRPVRFDVYSALSARLISMSRLSCGEASPAMPELRVIGIVKFSQASGREARASRILSMVSNAFSGLASGRRMAN